MEGKPMDIEGVLGEISVFGRFHVEQYILALLPVVFTAISNANYVFVADAVNYRCSVPECYNTTASLPPSSRWLNISDLKCSRPAFNDSFTNQTCNMNNFVEMRPCDRWIYESEYSIASDLDLACQDWKRPLVGTVHNVGVLISMLLLGYVSDRWGRSTAITISAVGLSVGALKTLTAKVSGGYSIYILLELIEAAVGAATYTSTFVLLIELGGKDRRVMSTACVGITIALGEILLAIIAWLLPEWQTLLLTIYCPALLFLSYVILLKESIRWLLINGKYEKTKYLMMKVAKLNKVWLSDNLLAALDEGNIVCDSNTTDVSEEYSIKLLTSSKIILKRVLICSWWWFSSTFIYYGLMIYSVSLPGNKYINFGLSSIMAIPGDIGALFLLDAYGRKFTLILGFTFCGVCCIANGFIPESATAVIMVVFLLGKASVSLCFNGVYVYTSELFPTSARSSLVGICSTLSRVGSIMAPLTPLLVPLWSPLPTLLFGSTALIAALLMLLTPETLNQELPDTVAQAERLEKKNIGKL